MQGCIKFTFFDLPRVEQEEMLANNLYKKKYSIVSLFSGCGGLDLGFKGGFRFLNTYYEPNPFTTILANDINDKAIATLICNFRHINAVCKDVTRLVEEDLPEADVLMGGFPCQDFSLAGKQQGLEVERGVLYKSMVAAIKKVKPKVFIAENVKGIILWKKGLAIRTIIDDFSRCGYKVNYKLINMADFGVPQKRERVFIIGIRNDIKGEFVFPEQTHYENPMEGQKGWITIEDAIKDLECEHRLRLQYNSGYSKAKKNKGQGNAITKSFLPAPTMRAEHHGNIEFHYKLPRRLAAREAARIQSFPDDFQFLSSTTDAYRQIGNAVAPVFAWHFARALARFLDDNVRDIL